MTRTLQLPVMPSTPVMSKQIKKTPKVKLNLTNLTSQFKDDSSAKSLAAKSPICTEMAYLPASPISKSRGDEIRLDHLLNNMEDFISR